MNDKEVGFDWNGPFRLVMTLKEKYKQVFGVLDTYSLATWIKKFNEPTITEIFENIEIKQHGNYVALKYIGDDWNKYKKVYPYCNNIVIDIVREQLILAPYVKMFNLEDIPGAEVSDVFDMIHSCQFVEYTDQLDGHPIMVRYYRGKFFFYDTKEFGETELVKLAKSMFTRRYELLVKSNKDCTMLFEMVHPRVRNIVNYGSAKTGLYLVGMIDMDTGDEYYYDTVAYTAKRYDVPTPMIEELSLDSVIAQSKRFKGAHKKGWVVNADGYRFKIKCRDYLNVAAIATLDISADAVIRNVAEGTLDQFMARVPEQHKEWVKEIADTLDSYVRAASLSIQSYYSQAPKENKKDFMCWVSEKVPVHFQGYVRRIYLGEDYHPLKTPRGYKTASDIELRIPIPKSGESA